MNDELIKKIEEIEKYLFEILGSGGFATFIHLIEIEKIRSVWKRAVAILTKKINKLSKPKQAECEKLITEFSELANKINLQKRWFAQDEIDTLGEESKNDHPLSAAFLKSLNYLQLKRYEIGKKDLAKYVLQSNVTQETINLRKFLGQKVELPEASVIFRVNDLLKDQNGDFDANASAQKEKKDHRIKSMFTAFSYIPKLQETIFREIKNISENPVIYSLYSNKAKKVIWAATKYLVEFTSSFVYEQIDRGLLPTEAKENAIDYFKSLPEKDPEMLLQNGDENLWLAIRKATIGNEKMTEENNRILFLDIIESMVYICRTGFAVADYFFSGNFRASSSEEKEVSGSDFSFDIELIDDGGKIATGMKETYSVALDPISKLELLHFATKGIVNPSLYPSIKDQTLLEKIDEFVTEPVSEFLKDQINYSNYINEQTYLNS